MNFPPFEIAEKFAVESVYYESPYGIHKPWKTLNSNELQELKFACPELTYIFDNPQSEYTNIKSIIIVMIILLIISLILIFKYFV